MQTNLIFPENTKDMYDQLNQQLEAITAGEPLVMPNLANAASLLAAALEYINWAGFYLMKGEELVLGPFLGNPACIRIALDRGVCGKAAKDDEIQCVPNVNDFEGYIACDNSTVSEIVIPIHYEGTVVGVLDIDSPRKHRFGKEDIDGLSEFVRILENNCRWYEFKVL